jgi:hypothetical protein
METDVGWIDLPPPDVKRTIPWYEVRKTRSLSATRRAAPKGDSPCAMSLLRVRLSAIDRTAASSATRRSRSRCRPRARAPEPALVLLENLLREQSHGRMLSTMRERGGPGYPGRLDGQTAGRREQHVGRWEADPELV